MPGGRLGRGFRRYVVEIARRGPRDLGPCNCTAGHSTGSAGTRLALPKNVPRAIRSTVCGFAVLATFACTACQLLARESRSPEQDRPPVEQLVEANPNIAARDLFYGVGGAARAPRADAPYRFLERDESGASTNLEVEDPNGRKWDAKLGVEAKSEVAASRLLWAIGFHQPPVYYVRNWRIASGEETGEQPEARFRLEQPNWKKDGTWAWQDNPFVGTRELQGLVVMMAILNSWDLKTSNNKVYQVEGGSPVRRYVVKDLGESLGRSVRIFLGTQNKVSDFTQERFIRDVKKDGRVDLYFEPVILNRSVEDDITVEDVLWTCRRLDRLSDRQWRDAFRAAGYSDEETTAYVDHLKRKVREGLAIGERAKT